MRLPRYDYRSPGTYFVTIVTAERRNLFGKVRGGAVVLSDHGRIAEACWRELPVHFSHTELGAFVIMPNHVHGILILRDSTPAGDHPVGARHVVPLPRNEREFGQPIGGALGTIIQQYKSSVTRRIRAKSGGASPIWQRNYHEHVIRDEGDWSRLHRYIEANPCNWATDTEKGD